MSKGCDKETITFKDIKNPYQFIAYLFRWHMKELLALVIVLLIAWILSMNISYDKKNGLQWRPAAKINASSSLKSDESRSNNPGASIP